RGSIRAVREARTLLLYIWVVARGFRWTILLLFATVLVGGLLYAVTPQPQLEGRAPSFPLALYAAWTAMLAQPVFAPANTWYLGVVCVLYPIIGLALIGEGVVRLGLLMFSKHLGEKEWMTVMASLCRDHVVLCGLGHLGYRILGALLANGVRVVA